MLSRLFHGYTLSTYADALVIVCEIVSRGEYQVVNGEFWMLLMGILGAGNVL